jgi:hypothetical protein
LIRFAIDASTILYVTREGAAISNTVTIRLIPVTPAVAVTVPTSLANLNSNLWAVIEGGSHLFSRSLRRSDKTQRGEQQRQCKQSFHNILLGYLRFTQRGRNREAAVWVGPAGCELLRKLHRNGNNG